MGVDLCQFGSYVLLRQQAAAHERLRLCLSIQSTGDS